MQGKIFVSKEEEEPWASCLFPMSQINPLEATLTIHVPALAVQFSQVPLDHSLTAVWGHSHVPTQWILEDCEVRL